MKNLVIGYAAVLAGAVLALLTLASLGDAQPNWLVTALLALLTMGSLGVGWYGLQRPSTPVEEA